MQLEEIGAIKKLMARYMDSSDVLCNKHDPQPFLDCLTKDIIWDGGPFGRYEGYDAVKRFAKEIIKQFTFSAHYLTNPDIEVEGREASGQWHILVMFTQNGEAMLLMGAQADKYKKVAGRWLISETKLIPFFLGPLAEGWKRS